MSAWIKMRINLWDDPRVSAIVDATDTSEAAVIGALYWLWATADDHTTDGMLVGMTPRQIDRKTGVAGFASAVESIGWIAASAEGVQVVRFEEHNGSSAKRRSSESRRKMSARDADKVRTTSGQGADKVRTKAGQVAHLEKELERDIDQEQDQEQKKGRAKKLALPDWLEPDVWSDWHGYRNSRKGWTPRARELSLRKLSKLHDAGHDPRSVIEQSIERGWTGLFPLKEEQPHETPRKLSSIERIEANVRRGQQHDADGFIDAKAIGHAR